MAAKSLEERIASLEEKNKKIEELEHEVKRLQAIDEIQNLINWANETLTPLVPISSGSPHFRGDTAVTGVPSTCPYAHGPPFIDLPGIAFDIGRIPLLPGLRWG